VNLDFTIYSNPPSPPTGFVAMPSDGIVRLAWTNPADSYFHGTTIRYKTTGYRPAPPTALLSVTDRPCRAHRTASLTRTHQRPYALLRCVRA